MSLGLGGDYQGQRDRQRERQRERERKQREREREKKRDRESERQTERERDKQTHLEKAKKNVKKRSRITEIYFKNQVFNKKEEKIYNYRQTNSSFMSSFQSKLLLTKCEINVIH